MRCYLQIIYICVYRYICRKGTRQDTRYTRYRSISNPINYSDTKRKHTYTFNGYFSQVFDVVTLYGASKNVRFCILCICIRKEKTRKNIHMYVYITSTHIEGHGYRYNNRLFGRQKTLSRNYLVYLLKRLRRQKMGYFYIRSSYLLFDSHVFIGRVRLPRINLFVFGKY